MGFVECTGFVGVRGGSWGFVWFVGVREISATIKHDQVDSVMIHNSSIDILAD